jgi:hypothetical protein
MHRHRLLGIGISLLATTLGFQPSQIRNNFLTFGAVKLVTRYRKLQKSAAAACEHPPQVLPIGCSCHKLGLTASFETQLLQTALNVPCVLSRVALWSGLDIEFEVAPLRLFKSSIAKPCMLPADVNHCPSRT